MSDQATTDTARRMWHLLETIHAIVYFAPEITAQYKALGLKGFWMGYFAGRAAPLGTASPELVTATFFNFHPAMVARALPDAWQIATPTEIIDVRTRAVDEALRRILGDTVDGPAMAETAELAETAAAGCTSAGRPMYAAHTTLPSPSSPHLRLWHVATLIREHRGDGHIAAQLTHGFTGLDAHITLCATGAVPRASIQPHRGWSDQDWEHASRRLADAGMLDTTGKLADTGREARASTELTTDRLALEPWQRLGTTATIRLTELLVPIARTVVASDVLPFPNPMGLPAPAEGR